MSEILRSLPRPTPSALPADATDFLRQLGGPVCIRVPGRDRGRLRAVTTLLHGNEPSGLRGVHAWLRSGDVPAVDTLLVIASVETALAPPGFAFRMLPGARDLNRCFFGPFDGSEGAVARAVLDRLRAEEPEALIDIHNNTGHNPPYAVGPDPVPACLGLASLFGDRFVHSTLRLGGLVEATHAAFPSVTAEVGRAGDPAADTVAEAGLRRFLSLERLPTDAPGMRILVNPVRVCVGRGVSLAYGEAPAPEADLTVVADVDRHNFERLAPGVPIAWLRNGADWPITAVDASGRELSRELFALRDQTLVTRRELVPIMMTTDAGIAASDCLFYAVEEAGERASEAP